MLTVVGERNAWIEGVGHPAKVVMKGDCGALPARRAWRNAFAWRSVLEERP
jgi:hypothetical protein